MEHKRTTTTIPTIWLIDLSPKEKALAQQVLSAFEETGNKYCTVDFKDKQKGSKLVIDFKTVNMSYKEGLPYYNHVFQQLVDMGYMVEKGIKR